MNSTQSFLRNHSIHFHTIQEHPRTRLWNPAATTESTEITKVQSCFQVSAFDLLVAGTGSYSQNLMGRSSISSMNTLTGLTDRKKKITTEIAARSIDVPTDSNTPLTSEEWSQSSDVIWCLPLACRMARMKINMRCGSRFIWPWALFWFMSQHMPTRLAEVLYMSCVYAEVPCRIAMNCPLQGREHRELVGCEPSQGYGNQQVS